MSYTHFPFFAHHHHHTCNSATFCMRYIFLSRTRMQKFSSVELWLMKLHYYNYEAFKTRQSLNRIGNRSLGCTGCFLILIHIATKKGWFCWAKHPVHHELLVVCYVLSFLLIIIFIINGKESALVMKGNKRCSSLQFGRKKTSQKPHNWTKTTFYSFHFVLVFAILWFLCIFSFKFQYFVSLYTCTPSLVTLFVIHDNSACFDW
jgi:hypothetical protein